MIGPGGTLRVLFVNENIGGHATVHLNLERALARHEDVQADFLHVPAPGLARRAIGASVPGLARLDVDLQTLRAQLAQSAVVRRRLRHIADRFDVLHIYTHNAVLLSPDQLRDRATVVTMDSTNALNAFRLAQRPPTRFTARLLPLTQWFERRVYDAATLLVANSVWVADSLRSTYSVAPDRIRELPFGVTIPATLPPVPPQSGLPAITFVGRQLERKGGNRLIGLHQAFLADRCTLNLVTTDDVPPAPGVRVYANFTPGDARLTELLRASRAFVFPSPIDQAPNAVLEAMAAAVPVVALRTGAVPEMVDDGVTGLLVDVDDDEGLVRAIETLLDDPERAAAMGAAGRRRAEQRYDIDRSATALLDILREAVHRHRCSQVAPEARSPRSRRRRARR